jgi:hypothetical protein
MKNQLYTRTYCERQRQYATEDDIIIEPCGAVASIKEHGKWYCHECWEKVWGNLPFSHEEIRERFPTMPNEFLCKMFEDAAGWERGSTKRSQMIDGFDDHLDDLAFEPSKFSKIPTEAEILADFGVVEPND